MVINKRFIWYPIDVFLWFLHSIFFYTSSQHWLWAGISCEKGFILFKKKALFQGRTPFWNFAVKDGKIKFSEWILDGWYFFRIAGNSLSSGELNAWSFSFKNTSFLEWKSHFFEENWTRAWHSEIGFLDQFKDGLKLFYLLASH